MKLLLEPIVKGYSKVGARLFVRKKIPRMTTVSSIACVSKDGLIEKSRLLVASIPNDF